MDSKELLEKYLSDFDKELLNKSILEKFYIYLNEIKKYNNKINLTSINTDQEIIIKHFIDSLYLLKNNIVSYCETILDVGSGAGLPGIPLSIFLPRVKITLLESNKNKVIFLNHIINAIRLKNVNVLQDRAEFASKNIKYRENFDLCIIRAFSNFNISLEVCSGFVKNNGFICFYASQKQSSKIKSNMKLFQILSLKINYKYNYELPNDYGKHSIIFVKKLWKTPIIYPRSLNKIRINPL